MRRDHRKQKLLQYLKRKHRMPSYRELAKLLGLRSASSAHDVIADWIEEGFVTKDSTGRIIPGELQWYLPLLGSIEAGFFPKDEDYGKSAILDDWLITNEHPTYMIRVRGNSMKEAAIIEGDHVVVMRTSECKPGDIVIARIDGCWTIKHLRVDNNGKQYLQACEDENTKIYPSHELKIVAVVTAVIRRYGT